MKVLKRPANKLNINAIKPREKATNKDLTIIIIIEKCMPKVAQTNIVMILENPNLVPGGNTGEIGIRDSRKDTLTDKAQKIDNKVIFNTLLH